MKLAIMEPYFFPYLGHFDLINTADEWVAFDTAQYTRHRWASRNRILHPNSGWQYIILPLVKHHQKTPFSQIRISENTDWRARILRQLHHYKKHAPYYAQVTNFVEECFSDPEANLAKFNTMLFRRACRRLGIVKPIHVLSEMNLTLGPINSPGDWGLRIAQALGASEFHNPSGGANILDENYYLTNGVKLTFQSFKNMTYGCGKYQFEPSLSILDVMMWNSCEEIKQYLDTHHLDSGSGLFDNVGMVVTQTQEREVQRVLSRAIWEESQ